MQDKFASLPSFSGQRSNEDNVASNKAGHCTAACVYQAKIAGYCRNVTVIWSKTMINHSVSITVENYSSENPCTCKIDLKPWPFWSKKGLKSLDVDGRRVDVYWDLRSAKFTGGSEPTSDYYVALVCDEEVSLLMGDYKKEAYKRTKARPSLVDATMVSKRENVFGKKCFSTRAKFEERHREHDIVVENSLTGPKDPEMWISIDGLVLIHITNLQWKFRGNETIMVNKSPVQVFWDVHNWLFCSPGSGHALFIFKPGVPDFWSDEDGAGDDEESESSRYYSVKSCGQGPQFCLFLYAWKVE
ncbi:hypothetical protein H6P81_008482 [Aristolochia fimbriata]|uniref:Uncharacterized protein n=1 Tax=Aristolochia fimbriata TaxID=158543 RepID=A0AAV7ELE6_ARIFI|nr:hypothetical protein H6P81_008482 [Aristolochia fimbriata]